MDNLSVVDLWWLLNRIDVISGTLSFLTIIAGIWLYFTDPEKRAKFFGYRPTAQLIIFDPDKNTVLLSQKIEDTYWSLPQGGNYAGDIDTSIERIINRELNGLEAWRYVLRFYKHMGYVKINDIYRTKRSTDKTFSIRRNLVGKQYTACFLQANLDGIKIKPGVGFKEVKIFSVEETEKLLQDGCSEERTSTKKEILKKVMDELKDYIKLRHNSINKNKKEN